MSSCVFLWVVIFCITLRGTLGYDDVLNQGLYSNPVAADHQIIEPHINQWSAEPVISPACPQHCICKKNVTHHIIISVDCSKKGLIEVPDLPKTTVQLCLRNNFLSSIDCTSFKFLRSLESVDLVSNRLSNLSSCVFQSQFNSLLNLSISRNNLTYLDVHLFQGLSHLELLNVSRNFISILDPKTFADLSRLVLLDLSFNKITTVKPEALKGLCSLKTLYLQNNLLDNNTSFHRDMFQDLGALETLNTQANRGRLDNAISPALRNLSHLYMSRFSFHGVLGAEFRQLINLRVLHLSMVCFTDFGPYNVCSWCILFKLPSNFFSNIRTKKDLELFMKNCAINSIGNDTFLPLSTLVTLDISNNSELEFGKSEKEKIWTENLSRTKLTYLDLSNTYMRVYDNFYCDWDFEGIAKTNLKTLILKQNKVTGLETPMRNFPTTIETLDMSYNCVSFKQLYRFFLTSDLPNFKLRELYFNACRLTPQTFQNVSNTFDNIVGDANSTCPYYNRLDEAEKELIQLEPSEHSVSLSPQNIFIGKIINRHQPDIAETRKLTSVLHIKPYCPLDMNDPDSNITIICLPTDLEVFCASSAIESFNPYPQILPHIRILNNTVLRRVELANNLLTSWIGPVENVPSLKFLDLSRNECANLSVNFFQHMVNLETLLLKENQLARSLADDFNGLTLSTLTKLRTLDMSRNDIKDLSSRAFIHSTLLETLDLSNNQLSGFQPTISTFLNMSFLDLSVNLLPGLSQQTCEELKLMKSRNKNFTINLFDNRLSLTCDQLPFLELVFSRPDIFLRVEEMKFQYPNRTSFYYKDLARHLPVLSRDCLVQRFFILILIIFFIVVVTVGFCAVIYHKRWKLRYLYYIGQRRMHIGEHVVDYAPDADVFVTYDQDDLHWRRFMQQTFLPGLNQRDITYILGETDFPGGDLMAHVTGAVVGTKKTVVLLSAEIFNDHHREYEMNLSIMREMDTRSLKIIPIFVEEVDLSLYPREIEVFLRNQWMRCLRYRDNDEFWDSFVNAVRENN